MGWTLWRGLRRKGTCKIAWCGLLNGTFSKDTRLLLAYISESEFFERYTSDFCVICRRVWLCVVCGRVWGGLYRMVAGSTVHTEWWQEVRGAYLRHLEGSFEGK